MTINYKIGEIIVSCAVHVAKTLGNYDIIIGQDLLHELGINIRFNTKTMCWNDVEVDVKKKHLHEQRLIPRGRRTIHVGQNRSHRKNIRCKIYTGQPQGIDGQPTAFNR